jgi:hypothetical protein
MKLFLDHRLNILWIALLLTICVFAPVRAATVTGTLQDISLQALNTKLTFAPTNEVLLTGAGLNAGPPRTIETVSGQFSIVLEAGDYTVTLPFVPWRKPFAIAVPNTNGTINITNLLSPPHAYTYTNNLNYTVKSIAADTGPAFLDGKIVVAGSLSKLLSTNSGSVSLVLSNQTGALHANAAPITSWSTNGETSLLDGTVALPAGNLEARRVIKVEAFGSFADPAANVPTVTFRLKLGSTVVVTQAKPVSTANWWLSALVTVRTAGASGALASSIGVNQDGAAADPCAASSQTATLDTTVALSFDLTATIDDYTQAERVSCEQLLVSFQ